MKSPTVLSIMVLVIVGAILLIDPSTVMAQQQQTFSDTSFGYRFSYPSGWVVEDLSGQYSQSLVEAAEEQTGYRGLFALCSEDDAIPALGGGYSCEALGSEDETESDAVYAFGFSDLDRKISRQLGQVTGTDATVEDAFAYFTQRVVGADNPDTTLNEERQVEDLVSRTPMTVPVVDSNGQVVAQANGLLVEYVYGSDIYGELLAPDIRAYQLFAIYNNDAVAIGIEGEADDVDSGEVPEILQIIADSFAFTNTAATTTPSQPPAVNTAPLL